MRRKIDWILLVLQIVIILFLTMILWRLFHDDREISAAGNMLVRLAGVSIDTQAMVKQEQSKSPDDQQQVNELRKKINKNFAELIAPGLNRNFQNNPDCRQMLSRLYIQWRKLEVMLEASRISKSNEQDLLMLSISFHDQSNRILEVTEKYIKQRENRIKTAHMYEFILLSMLISIAFARILTRDKTTPFKSESPK